jgi:hypothetical protein
MNPRSRMHLHQEACEDLDDVSLVDAAGALGAIDCNKPFSRMTLKGCLVRCWRSVHGGLQTRKGRHAVATLVF